MTDRHQAVCHFCNPTSFYSGSVVRNPEVASQHLQSWQPPSSALHLRTAGDTLGFIGFSWLYTEPGRRARANARASDTPMLFPQR